MIRPTRLDRVFARTGRLVGIVALVLWLGTPAIAQERRSELTATYQGLGDPPANAPANIFRYTYTDRNRWIERVAPQVPKAAVRNEDNPATGILGWEVPASDYGTASMDRNFRTYCAEAPIRVIKNNTYKFEIQSPAVPEAYGLPDTEAGKTESFRRAAYVRELFGMYYVPSLSNNQAARAFQIALWEIIHEASWPEGQPAPLNLSAGTFQAAAQQDDPGSVTLARDYLKSLTGNDNVFYENPDLAGRELVRMKGLASPQASDAIPQSQFALRYTRGGASAPGVNAGPFGGVPGGFGGGGLGGGGGGLGYGGGAGAFAGIGSGGGSPSSTSGTSSGTTGTSTTTTPTTPPSDTTTTTTAPPNQPPTTPTPPINGPPTDGGGTPVPAPAGLVLGLIAVGAFVSRRAFVRASKNN